MTKYSGIIILLVLSIAIAQNVAELEQKRTQLFKQMIETQKEIAVTDSQLNTITTKIDKEKTKKNPDKGILEEWMAKGLHVSKQQLEQNQKLDSLQNELNKLDERLDYAYAAKIDSLEKLKQSSNSASAKELNEKILKLTEKRLIVAPKMKALNFDPQKIQQIQLDETSDSLTQIILMDYLENALTNVNGNLENIKRVKQETEDFVLLSQKTQEFLEEVNSERDFGVLTHSYFDRTGAERLGTDGTVPNNVENAFINKSAQSILLFLQQLDASEMGIDEITRKVPLDSTEMSVSPDEYLKLLNKTEKTLKQYQSTIQRKLKNIEKNKSPN